MLLYGCSKALRPGGPFGRFMRKGMALKPNGLSTNSHLKLDTVHRCSHPQWMQQATGQSRPRITLNPPETQLVHVVQMGAQVECQKGFKIFTDVQEANRSWRGSRSSDTDPGRGCDRSAVQNAVLARQFKASGAELKRRTAGEDHRRLQPWVRSYTSDSQQDCSISWDNECPMM